MSLKKTAEFVKKHKYFLVTSHTNPEGDALGSELAFYRLLKGLGKGVTLMNEDSLPYGYDFFPQKDKIKKFNRNLINRIKFDCLVVLDCSDLKRTGQVYKINTGHKPVLNIDHHISNKKFGDVNWIEPGSSSCCEMIYKLYKKLRFSLDRESAILLYAGILTDTGSFRYPNTTAFTHKAVSELLEYNLDIPFIYKSVYENIPYRDLKLLSKILLRIRLSHEGKVAWFKIEKGMLRRKLSFDLTEHVLSFARAIKGVEVVALFKENLGRDDEVRLNLRSQGKIDVNKIAQVFGGGGHKTASGATVSGKIDRVINEVLAKIKESLK